MDTIAAGGDTAAGEKIEAGGLELTERASIDLDLFGLRSEPYRERTIERDTRYVFDAGKPVFLLVSPEGARYAMQAYAAYTHQGLSADFVKEYSLMRLFWLLIHARLGALYRLPRMLAKRRQIRDMRTISVLEWYGLISRFKLDAIELALKY